MQTQSIHARQFRWLPLLAVAGGGMLLGACAERHHDDVETQHVVLQDEYGNSHEGYYDERHAWHGGYYDTGRQFHRDPEDWRRGAAEAIHPELRRNDAAARAGAPIEGRDQHEQVEHARDERAHEEHLREERAGDHSHDADERR